MRLSIAFLLVFLLGLALSQSPRWGDPLALKEVRPARRCSWCAGWHCALADPVGRLARRVRIRAARTLAARGKAQRGSHAQVLRVTHDGQESSRGREHRRLVKLSSEARGLDGLEPGLDAWFAP